MHKPMFAPVRWGALGGAIVLIGAGLAGCADTGKRLSSVVTPYRTDVVQGNFISSEQVRALQPGMGRQQVREILGTPLMVSVFHSDRWEYVFTLKRPDVEVQTRKLTVFFKDNVMERVEGDEMPTEAEFVASLSTKVSKPKVPQLEATEAQLARFPKAEPAAEPDAAPALPPTTSYPPLESPRR
ncbi:outer membrane protein assembly factor BamE [Diaphorobacter sp. LR2014-1]|uniref:outer membrane protein assembly factor BamE n=1 Tax=Diaphorobacter sp. LR2014-1 TaxID=1933219 RepID=UPI000CDA3295|nr:outer membrane protein assembly factor BamE [Diaphorobacter sp. LR2014-1]POR09723.1 cell envelope protein SmpA [Diaphorobacter sp. LR2014-1]